MKADSPAHPVLWLFSYSISILKPLSTYKSFPIDAMLKQQMKLDPDLAELSNLNV